MRKYIRFPFFSATLLGGLLMVSCIDSGTPPEPISDMKESSDTSEPSLDTSSADVQSDASVVGQWGPADLSCSPPLNPSVMPATAREYAELCAQHGLGIPPTVSCDDGIRVPTTVEGEEVFENVGSCDHTSMLKPGCVVGSKIGRVQGQDAEGNALPDVVWIYFCRAAAQTTYSSVQMIAHHYTTGATCFFEANEGAGSILPETLGRDEFNGLTGQLPGPEDANFDRAFVPAPVQCVECHQNNAFIRNPWLDGARLPENPSEPVLPTVDALSPYYIVGGAEWDMRTIHIEGNACLTCHRIGMEIDQTFMENGFNVNTYMPPYDPGSMADDYQALLNCWQSGPEATPGCEWIIPPAGDCQGGIVGPDYPYASAFFNQLGSKGKEDDDFGFVGSDCPETVEVGAPCEGDLTTTLCSQNNEWFWCEGGSWQSK